MGEKYNNIFSDLRKEFMDEYGITLSRNFEPTRFFRSFYLDAKIGSVFPGNLDSEIAKNLESAKISVQVESESQNRYIVSDYNEVEKKAVTYAPLFEMKKPSKDAEKLAPAKCYHGCPDAKSNPFICKHIYRALAEIDKIPGCYETMFTPNENVLDAFNEIENNVKNSHKKLKESFGLLGKLELDESKCLDRLNRRVWDLELIRKP
jgi:hypothetical protein